jgi:hypothetical protein
MSKVTQLVLSLESKPGVLANIGGILAKAGINIEGLCAGETTWGRGKVRLLVANPAAAETALKAAKMRCGREEAVTVTLENRPGALAEAAQKLSKARINVKCAYATASGAGQAVAVLTVANAQKALAALGG